MDRERFMLISIGIGVIIISISILIVFIASETQVLLVEHSSMFNGHYSLHPIRSNNGVDLMVLCFVLLGSLIILAALLQPRFLSWLTSLGFGAFITIISFPIDNPFFSIFYVFHIKKSGIPFGWLTVIYPPPPSASYIYGVVIQSFLIDLIIWSIIVKILMRHLSQSNE